MVDYWYIRKQRAALIERERDMPSTIRKGSTGADVRLCQELLNEQGFSTGVDGVFGSGTEKSVKSFQSAKGLTADGLVGPATWAALETPAQKLGSVEFSKVAELFPYLFPQTYVLSGAQCPSNPPGISLKRIGQETSNCVLFTAWLLSTAFHNVYPSIKFVGDQWSKWMVSGKAPTGVAPAPDYGPKVIMEWGMGKPQPSAPGPWLVQTFSETGGHSYIVLADDPSGKILTLESNASLNGCGWNQIGPLREIENPGPNWADKVTQTWANRIYSNRAVHICSLNITGVQEWLESAQ
jgi:hypothetical protein